MDTLPLPANNSRVGFHYFPDSVHYRDIDLQNWLPVLKKMNCSWLCLNAPLDRAIPESFIEGLTSNSIEPLIQFNLNPSTPIVGKDFSLLLNSYSRWGIRYILLFDRPNMRKSWTAAAWAQQDLVERFLDRFIPLANLVLEAGMLPVFPPLEPGGDYWDTTFLKASLESLKRRGQNAILDHMVIAAYGNYSEKGINWGAGGPERWPGAKPYHISESNEDQRGFHIYEWYNAISKISLDRELPILLLGVGSTTEKSIRQTKGPTRLIDSTVKTQYLLSVFQLLNGEKANEPGAVEKGMPAIPGNVIGCNFWLLCADPASAENSEAWFKSETEPKAIVQVVQDWLSARKSASKINTQHVDPNLHPIAHYLLLPSYEWGISDWHLDAARPFIKNHAPTIGFSLQEAALAMKVTVVGGPQTFSDETLQFLRDRGCSVERISGDGTSIATLLAER